MLGIRLGSAEFAEDKFLSLFDRDTATAESGPVTLKMQVRAGKSEFSKYPPKGMDVIEIPMDLSIDAENANGVAVRDLFAIRFLGGFIPLSKIDKAEFKKAFEKVRDEFQVKLYYAARPKIQEIVNCTVLREMDLPWDINFNVAPSSTPERIPPKATKRNPANNAAGNERKAKGK